MVSIISESLSGIVERVVWPIFSRLQPSIPVMQALAFIGLIHSLFYFNEAVMFGLGKPFWRLGLHSLIAFGNVIGFLIAIHWGIVAVAISYVVVGYLFAPVAL